MSISAVILAAGGAERMGQPKQLLLVGGAPMLLRVFGAVVDAGIADIVVVLGASAPLVAPLLSGKAATLVINGIWREGIASSIRVGLAHIAPRSEAVLFVPADLPRLSAQSIRSVIERFQAGGADIVIPTCGGQRGNPVLFARSLFGELRSLHGDVGGRALFGSHAQDIALVEVGDRGVLLDVDTPAHYRAAVAESDEDQHKENV